MTRRLARWACVVALVAAGLRLPRLELRPMHADEAVLADKFGVMLARGSYAYDPAEYHGPLLAYATAVPAYLTGRRTYVELTEATLRVVPALAGVLLALTPFLFAGALGEAGAVMAALLIAVSPACVFYSRYYIPEMTLALFTATLLASLWRVAQTGSAVAQVCAGASAAAMLATKETAVIALAAALPFALLLRRRVPVWSLLAFALVLAVCIDPWLLLQSFAPYWRRGTATAIHSQPPLYYLGLLVREPLLCALAVAGFFAPAPNAFARSLKACALLLLLAYSAVPYKTPWIVVNLVVALALVAGIGVPSLLRRARSSVVILVAAGLAHMAWQAWDASFRRPADPRNPWVYAQTGTDVFAIRNAVLRFGPDVPVGVYTRENFWPLPWYLRRNPRVRWSRQVVTQGAASPVVLASPEMEPALQSKFYEGPPAGQRELYMSLFPEPVYLRPGVEVRGYVRKSLWDEGERR